MPESDPTAVRSAQALADANEYFRQTIVTGEHAQLVAMTIPPGEEIGEETHEGDQVLSFTTGSGEAVIDGASSPIAAGDVIFVPAGTLHNFVNTGEEPLRLLTIYAPPEHEAGTVHKTRKRKQTKPRSTSGLSRRRASPVAARRFLVRPEDSERSLHGSAKRSRTPLG